MSHCHVHYVCLPRDCLCAQMLDQLQREPFETSRRMINLIMLCNIVHKLVDFLTNQLILPTRNTRANHAHKLRHIQTTRSYHQQTFSLHTIPAQNMLPANIQRLRPWINSGPDLATHTLPSAVMPLIAALTLHLLCDTAFRLMASISPLLSVLVIST